MPTLPHSDRVMREWCLATDTAPWHPDECANFAVRDFDVGLLFKLDSLHVIGDLGLSPSPELQEHLLRLNGEITSSEHGSYALHPQGHTIVYRLDIALTDDTDGAALPRLLESSLDRARVRALF